MRPWPDRIEARDHNGVLQVVAERGYWDWHAGRLSYRIRVRQKNDSLPVVTSAQDPAGVRGAIRALVNQPCIKEVHL